LPQEKAIKHVAGLAANPSLIQQLVEEREHAMVLSKFPQPNIPSMPGGDSLNGWQVPHKFRLIN